MVSSSPDNLLKKTEGPCGLLGAPEDIGAAAIYLAARSGDYVIGETLTVDGGLVHAELGASIDG